MKVSSRASVDLPEPDFADHRQRAAGLERKDTSCKRLHVARVRNRPRDTGYSRLSARASRTGSRCAPCSRACSHPAASGARQRARPSAGAARRRRGGGRRRKRNRSAARTGSLAAGRTGRHDAGNGRQPPLRRALRQRRQQRGGIGMMRVLEQGARRIGFNLLAGVLHDDAIRRLGHHAHVVGDEHQRHAVVAAATPAADRGSAPAW